MLTLEIPQLADALVGEIAETGDWIIANLETSISWPVAYQRQEYAGRTYFIIPLTKDHCPAVAIRRGDETLQESRSTLLRFLSAMSWTQSAGAIVQSFSGGGLPRPQRRGSDWGMSITPDLNLTYLPEPEDPRSVLALVLQKTISPFDAYTYLHARFGAPNGLQTFLARDDSDNLFHWDYYLKAGDAILQFIGATEEVRVWFEGRFSDADCLTFIANMRADFGRVSQEKGRFASSLEKWNIFPNQYLAIANRCAELYETICDALPKIEKKIVADNLATQNLAREKNKKSHGKLMAAITTAPTELAVLIPVMFESFIGLLVAGFIRPEIKRDQAAFTAFVRLPLNRKLERLADNCRGFARPIEQNNPAFGRYWSVVNRRNDLLHGNVDPVRDALEVVYFHGKRPLYNTGGDRIRQLWLRLIDQYNPQGVVDDYLAMHAFIIEILDHLTPSNRQAFGYRWSSRAINQLLALQSQQLGDLAAALAAQGRAEMLGAARDAAAEAEGRERFRRFRKGN